MGNKHTAQNDSTQRHGQSALTNILENQLILRYRQISTLPVYNASNTLNSVMIGPRGTQGLNFMIRHYGYFRYTVVITLSIMGKNRQGGRRGIYP